MLAFDKDTRLLPGIRKPVTRQVFIEQILESIHRIEFVKILQGQDLSDRRADPNDPIFDPLKAAIIQKRRGNLDEAFWLVFILTHFGQHPQAGWRYAREIYGKLGNHYIWDWSAVSQNPSGFREWLNDHQADLKRKGIPRGFGNHRKYQSLDAFSQNGTGAAVESYVSWVNPPRRHHELVEQTYLQSARDKKITFDQLYVSMSIVRSFGRTGRYDYLTMLNKIDLAPIEPGRAYLPGSTGPLRGARLLFGNQLAPRILDEQLVELDVFLQVGIQVLEDALCNWQKSPTWFRRFRG